MAIQEQLEREREREEKRGRRLTRDHGLTMNMLCQGNTKIVVWKSDKQTPLICKLGSPEDKITKYLK